jgi:hypothetical protein
MATIRLEWPASPAAELVSGYKVWEYVNGNMEYPNLLGVTPVPWYEIPNHVAGQFAWAVSAVNIAGESVKSDVTQGPSVPTKPGPVTVTVV